MAAAGACTGVGRAAFEAGKGDKNKRAFRRVVAKGPAPGILAYARDEAVGWCALGPRAAYPRLAGSRVLAPVDAAEVWSVTCFFVADAWPLRVAVLLDMDQTAYRIALGFPLSRGHVVRRGH